MDWSAFFTEILTGQVLYTNDGDTAVFATADGTEVRVRFVGIDTPETHLNGKDQGKWAFAAADRLKELLPNGQAVKIKLDRLACDSRNRTLGYVYVNGININQLMVAEGWAVNYCVAPNLSQCDELKVLVEQNILEKRGFIADATVKLPYIFREDEYKSDYQYYIGDINTKRVIRSSHMDEVPVAQRVFFYSARQIRRPYRLAPGVK